VLRGSADLNPHDKGEDLASSEPNYPTATLLFSLIQQSVEAALLPLTTAHDLRSGLRTDGVSRWRERLALELVDSENFIDDPELIAISEVLARDWSEHKDRIDRIRSRWREAHRVSIGSSFELIAARISDEQMELAAPP
jgi:hypothetical protein